MKHVLGILAGAAVFFAASSVNAAPQNAGGVELGSAAHSMVLQAQYDGARRFNYPHMHGAVVDWCAVWANGCGWEGAHQFCSTRGFARATSWDIDRPGRTYVIGSDRFCEADFCKGFRQVTCVR